MMTSGGSPKDFQNLPGKADFNAGLLLMRNTLWRLPADGAARS